MLYREKCRTLKRKVYTNQMFCMQYLKRECLERASLAFEHQSLDFWEELVTKKYIIPLFILVVNQLDA